MIVVYSGVLVVVGCDEARERGQVFRFQVETVSGPVQLWASSRKDSSLQERFGSGFRVRFGVQGTRLRM